MEKAAYSWAGKLKNSFMANSGIKYFVRPERNKCMVKNSVLGGERSCISSSHVYNKLVKGNFNIFHPVSFSLGFLQGILKSSFFNFTLLT